MQIINPKSLCCVVLAFTFFVSEGNLPSASPLLASGIPEETQLQIWPMAIFLRYSFLRCNVQLGFPRISFQWTPVPVLKVIHTYNKQVKKRIISKESSYIHGGNLIHNNALWKESRRVSFLHSCLYSTAIYIPAPKAMPVPRNMTDVTIFTPGL